MRTANFRDDVLWPIAYKLGLDPATDFLKDQADALASYINAWVRRLWDGADWPEWTVIGRFSPQNAPGLEHIVSYTQRPIGYLPPPFTGPDVPDAPAPGNNLPPLIGKVLRVYLVDPRTTWGPVDTPFRLNDHGVHCGFEHGNSVWIKFIPRAPKFTALEWDADLTYKKDALVYSPVSGECYLSKSNGNRGHEPTQTSESETPNVLTTEITREFVPANPGLPETAQIVEVLAAPGTTFGTAGTALVDPPPEFTVFEVKVLDVTGTILSDVAYTADGIATLEDVFTDLASQLAADTALSGFTVTSLTSPPRIRLENLSVFDMNGAYFVAGVSKPLAVQQIQAYTPSVAPSDATPKQLRLSINESQVLPGETYTLTFTSLDGAEHPVVYSSSATDGAEQILAGLAAAIVTLQGADTFFTGIQSTLDLVSPAMTFTVAPTLAKTSLNAVIQSPGSIWWSYVPFPLALVDQVVRGAYADALKEGGQPDKAGPEEQAVPTEQTVRMNAMASKQFDAFTDQQITHSRYSHGEKA